MWELYCPICCSTFRPNDAKHFRSLACGHIFCEGCILRHFEAREHKRQDPDCPSCRAPATEDDVRPIYFEIRDGNGELVQVEPSTSGSSPAIMQHLNHVRKGLQMIEPGTAESSVKKTGDKIWEIVDTGDTIAQTELLKEVASFFKQRVVPIFSEILERRNEVDLLRKQAREDKVEKDRLGRTIQLDRQAATGSNARLTDKVENLEAANAQLLKEVDLLRREKSDREALEKDIKSYKGQLELWKDNEKKWKATNKALKIRNKQQQDEIDALKAEGLHPGPEEDSLVIEHEPMDDGRNRFLDSIIENTHRPHKRQKLGTLDFNAEESSSSDTYDSSPSPAIKRYRQRSPSPVGTQRARKASSSRPTRISASLKQVQPSKPKFDSGWALPARTPPQSSRDTARSLPFPMTAEGKTDIKKLQPGPRPRMAKSK